MVGELSVRLLGALALGLGGWRGGVALGDALESSGYIPWGLALTLVGVVLGLGATPYFTTRPVRWGLRWLGEIPASTLIAGSAGLIVGLIVAVLLSVPLTRIPGATAVWLPISLSVLLAYLGVVVGVSRERELLQLLPEQHRGRGTPRQRLPGDGQLLVDTSAIIDGRIADISQAGFVRGTLVIPRFILDELRHVADSSDSLRRNRGRRGLEMLNKLCKEADVPIQVLDVDTRDGMEVDGKLVKLAKSLHASIVTTDFNLNRVAEIEGVRVLNVNELANALKPVVLPGEEMSVRVIQEGKEPGQGVAFLDDGTMVVVEHGRRHINQHLDVVITRVLQTAAGRIIFAQPRT